VPVQHMTRAVGPHPVPLGVRLEVTHDVARAATSGALMQVLPRVESVCDHAGIEFSPPDVSSSSSVDQLGEARAQLLGIMQDHVGDSIARGRYVESVAAYRDALIPSQREIQNMVRDEAITNEQGDVLVAAGLIVTRSVMTSQQIMGTFVWKAGIVAALVTIPFVAFDSLFAASGAASQVSDFFESGLMIGLAAIAFGFLLKTPNTISEDA